MQITPAPLVTTSRGHRVRELVYAYRPLRISKDASSTSRLSC